jgi:membrane associated rhomboid family serine protease
LHKPCQPESEVSDQEEANLREQYSAGTRERLFNIPPIIVIVVGLLIAIQALQQFKGEHFQIFLQAIFAFNPARFGPNPINQLAGSAYWSMLTYGLLHADWTHLGFNSLWLVVFSKPVVLRLGTVKYLVLLIVSIFAGALAGLVVHWGEFLVMVGISAGVSGMISAAIPVMYANGFRGDLDSTQVSNLFPLTPLEILRNRPALAFTLLWLALTMFTATSQYLTGTAFLEERVIAWEAHLGGFIAGFIAFYLLDRKSKRA